MAIELVTLEQAKKHLHIDMEVTDSDPDIHLKIEHASGIIIDYLNSRAHTRSTVASSSVANPTVITTSATHLFINGDTVILSGHENSAPDLNGSHVISNVTTTTFTVPVTVTVAGTGGLAMVHWTDETVPVQVQASVLVMLTHLHEHAGDDMTTDEVAWKAIERLLARSRDPAFA